MRWRRQPPAAGVRGCRAPAEQHVFGHTRRVDGAGQRAFGLRRAQKYGGPERPESRPQEFLTQRRAPRGRHRVGQHQLPGAVPVVGGPRVDAPMCVVEPALAFASQPVAAHAAVRRRVEPSVLRQPEYARTHQALVDAEGRHQTDEPGQPRRSSMRSQRVAPDSDDQRLGARRLGLRACAGSTAPPPGRRPCLIAGGARPEPA